MKRGLGGNAAVRRIGWSPLPFPGERRRMRNAQKEVDEIFRIAAREIDEDDGVGVPTSRDSPQSESFGDLLSALQASVDAARKGQARHGETDPRLSDPEGFGDSGESQTGT